MRLLILPSARAEVFALVGHHERIDQVLLWHPQDLGHCLTLYDAKARTLCVATELTAGVVNKLLFFSLLCVTLVYVFVRLRLQLGVLKVWLWITIAAGLIDLLVVSGVVYLVSVYPEISGKLVSVLRGLSIISIIAYTALFAGTAWMVFRQRIVQSMHHHATVNSNS
jgi:hypothetical protein